MSSRETLNFYLSLSFSLLAILLITYSGGIIQIIFALPLVFYLPGHALMMAMFRRQSLGSVERFLICIGTSLAITIIGGFTLNLASFGLQKESWAIFLGGFICACVLIALFRFPEYRKINLRRIRIVSNLKAYEKLLIGLAMLVGGFVPACVLVALFRHPEYRKINLRRIRIVSNLRAYEKLLIGLAMLLLAGAIAEAVVGTLQQQRPPFTQLWMLPVTKTSQEYVQIGIHSSEKSFTQYRLEIHVSDSLVQEWSIIGLNPEETWETTTLLPVSMPNGSKVEAYLFLLTDPEAVYRHVFLRAIAPT